VNQDKRISRLIREAEKAQKHWTEALDRLANAVTAPKEKAPYPDLTRLDAKK
jgi:hypothetical protein